MDPLPKVTLREATAGDAEAIEAIYTHYVLHSDCTMQTEPGTAEARRAWLAAQGRLPTLVAVRAGEVIGWGALTEYSPRGGYRWTAEDSVYLRPDATGGGVGAALLGELLERARALGLHSVLARITATQEPSIRLHARFGFVEAGRLREAGQKLGRWVDVLFMQRLL